MGNTSTFNQTEEIKFGKLVCIKDDKLEIYNDEITMINNDKKCYVITMIGCARIGKSTYINAFLSHLLKRNIDIAKTSTSFQHCTTGVDYIYVSYDDINIIVLDSQGLNYDDSKYDDKILTFLYSVSNIMIFHCSNIIDNQVLSSLTSLCIVSNYVKDTVKIKPTLYFRIRDYSLEADPKDFLNNTFEEKLDQYDAVRKAIRTLFPKMDVFVTETLDKKTLNTINTHKNFNVLDNFNFTFTFDTILTEYKECNCIIFQEFVNKIHQVLYNFNSIQDLSCKDYDYYSLIVNARFTEFWDSIEPYVFTEIQQSMLQSEVYKCLRIIDIVENHSLACINHFTSMDKEILNKKCDEHKNRILNDVKHKMERNIIESKKYALTIVPIIDQKIKKEFEKLHTSIHDGAEVIFIRFEEITYKIINEHVVDDFNIEWKKYINNVFIKKLNEQKIKLIELEKFIKKLNENVINDVHVLLNEYISSKTDKYVEQTYLIDDQEFYTTQSKKTLLNKLYTKIFKNIVTIIDENSNKLTEYVESLKLDYMHDIDISPNNIFTNNEYLETFKKHCKNTFEVRSKLQKDLNIKTDKDVYELILLKLLNISDVLSESYKNHINELALTNKFESFDMDVITSYNKSDEQCLNEFGLIIFNGSLIKDVLLDLGFNCTNISLGIIKETFDISDLDLYVATSMARNDNYAFISTHENVKNVLKEFCNMANYKSTFIDDNAIYGKTEMLTFHNNSNPILNYYEFEDNLKNNIFFTNIMKHLLDKRYKIE